MSEEILSERLSELGGNLANHLVGQISTLLDSILADERQAKAAKDLARGLIWDTEHERSRAEEYILTCYWRNPKVGIFPEWKEKKLKKEDKEQES